MYVYRWCERTDVVEKARAAFGLKPALPDFYNILLERPRHDPAGYGKWRLPLNFPLNESYFNCIYVSI